MPEFWEHSMSALGGTPLSIQETGDIVTIDASLVHVPVDVLPLTTLGIKVFVALITPEIARVIWQHKNINRGLHLSQIRRLERALTQQRWQLNGEPLIFDADGRLVEGQHRIKAVIDTDVSIITLVVHGIDWERFSSMGLGSKRSVGDILGIRGVKNSRHIAAALRWVYRYEHDLMSNPHPNITDDELADTFPAHAALAESFAFGTRAQGLAAPGMVTAFHYLCTKLDRATANDFFWKFGTGEHLEEGDVILVLRNRMLKSLSGTNKRTRLVLRDEQKAPMIALAWNVIRKRGWVKIKTSASIAWHGKVGQKFPKLL